MCNNGHVRGKSELIEKLLKIRHQKYSKSNFKKVTFICSWHLIQTLDKDQDPWWTWYFHIISFFRGNLGFQLSFHSIQSCFGIFCRIGTGNVRQNKNDLLQCERYFDAFLPKWSYFISRMFPNFWHVDGSPRKSLPRNIRISSKIKINPIVGHIEHLSNALH